MMLGRNHFTVWYSIATLSVIMLLALRWLSYIVLRFLGAWFISIITKCAQQRLLRKNAARTTVGHVILYVLVFGANITCSIWGVNSLDALKSRIASLLLTNVALLSPGADIIADVLRISLSTYKTAHTLVAIIALIQSILHPCLEVYHRGLTWNFASASGLTASCSVVITALTSITPIQKHAYEIFRLIHLWASALINVFLWFHLSQHDIVHIITLIASNSIWSLSLIYRYSILLYRNHTLNGRSTTAVLEIADDALKLQITPARPWKVLPGQYVYLTIGTAGLFSPIQRHPFMVASPILSNSIEIHIWPRKGFTEKLFRLSPPAAGVYHTCSAWIEGPYGFPLDLRQYGTVMFIASGIGITGHLSYLRNLIEEQDCFDTKTRDVVFIWYMEKGFNHHPAQDFMDELLRRDKETNHHTYGDPTEQTRTKKQRNLGSSEEVEYPGNRPVPSGNNILDIYIYREDSPVLQRRSGERLVEIRGKPDYSGIIDDIVGSRQGKIAILACANRSIINQVRTKVSQTNKDVRLFISNFEPFDTQTTQDRRSMSLMCRGID